MLNQRRLELLKKTNLHLWRNLSIVVEGVAPDRLRVTGHPETANSHAFALKYGVDETFNSVLEKYIANVADLAVPLRPHARV